MSSWQKLSSLSAKILIFFGFLKMKLQWPGGKNQLIQQQYNRLPNKSCFQYIKSVGTFIHSMWELDCPKRQQGTTYNIQQKTRQMSRHYWDIYTTYDIEFLGRKKWKKNVKRNFFQNFKFFYIKLPNVICCIQCCLLC